MTAKALQQIVSHPAALVGQDRFSQPQPLTDEGKQFVNALFAQLKLSYPAWRHTIKSDEEERMLKRHWATELQKAGVQRPEQFRRGMDQAAHDTSPHWPSVGQFITWAQGEDTEEAWQRMLKGRKPQDMAEMRTWEAVAYRCRTQLAAAPARALFDKTLADFKRRQAAGEFPAEILPQLPARVRPHETHQKVLSYEPKGYKARAFMDRLQRMKPKNTQKG